MVLPLAALLALSACHRGSEQGKSEPVVQGASGSGNAGSATDSTGGGIRQAGVGLNGGMGGSSSGTGLTGTFPASSVGVGSSPVAITDGSTNRTTKGSVGNR